MAKVFEAQGIGLWNYVTGEAVRVSHLPVCAWCGVSPLVGALHILHLLDVLDFLSSLNTPPKVLII